MSSSPSREVCVCNFSAFLRSVCNEIYSCFLVYPSTVYVCMFFSFVRGLCMYVLLRLRAKCMFLCCNTNCLYAMKVFLFRHSPFDCATLICYEEPPPLCAGEGERILSCSSTLLSSISRFCEPPPPLRSPCGGDEFLCVFDLLPIGLSP